MEKKLYSIKWKDQHKRLLEVICNSCLKRIQANPSYYGVENLYLFKEDIDQTLYVCDQCSIDSL